MKKKFKVTFVVFLVVIFGCFSQVFAADKANDKVKKSIGSGKNVKLLDGISTTNYVPKKDYSANLVAKWVFDDTDSKYVSGNTVKDLSGHGNDLTLSNVKFVDDANLGRCAYFNGSNSYATANNKVVPIGKKSVLVNVKPSSADNKKGYLMTNMFDGGTESGWLFEAYSNEVAMNIGNSSGKDWTRLQKCDNTYGNKILYTYDGTTNDNGTKMFVSDLSTPIFSGACSIAETNTPNRNLYVGEISNWGTYEGYIKSIEIYNDVIEYNNASEAINLNKTTDTLNVGQTDTLTATVTPDNATNKKVNWKSSDENVVKVDKNGNITAEGKGIATVTATIDGTDLSTTCTVTVNNPLILNIEPEKTKININDIVSANLTIDNIQDIAAEDVRIKYDSTKLQFLNYAEVEGIKLVENNVKDGELRFILASKGKTNIIDAKKILLKLNFKGIAAGDALVDVTNGRVSDGITKEWDLTDEQCGQATITIQKLSDVNNSGEYTLLDLAIDARHEGEDPNTLPQYNTDQDGNKAIDDDDLTLIGKYMLENVNYTPNNIK